MITVKEAAKILRLQPGTVRLRCLTGQIVGAVKFGQAWMIPDIPIYKRRAAGRPPTKRDE